MVKTPPERIAPFETEYLGKIAGLLDEEPKGLGRPIDDRGAWQVLARLTNFQRVISDAKKSLDQSPLELTEGIYLDFIHTGEAKLYTSYSTHTRSRFCKFVLAECLENQGLFLPDIHQMIRGLCEEKTWVHAFHDPRLTNWHGETTHIDLDAATVAWSLATAQYFLGDRLETETQQMIRWELRHRIFDPFLRMLEGKLILLNQTRSWSWLELTHNWNAVCLAGVVGAALTIIKSRDERSMCIAAAERYTRNFLSGFPEDGSCSEGIGYWNYGFGHFLMLNEAIWQATRGRMDLLENKQVRLIAQYGAHLEIMPSVYPAFADCGTGTVPDTNVMRFVNRRYGMGLGQWENREPEPSSLQHVAVFVFPNSSSQVTIDCGRKQIFGMRSWFQNAGILVERPRTSSNGAIGIAIKGGHNAEHHNHNDLASFVVALNGKLLLTDPGSERYTVRTFSERRYESNVLNSYGHSAPLVAGQLQKEGDKARARILKQELIEERDLVVFDLRSAYDVASLVKLHRSFLFSRQGAGRLMVIDEVSFTEPEAFSTALITFNHWREVAEGILEIFEGEDALRVEIRVDGGNFEITSEEIKENVRVKGYPTRIAIDLTNPVQSARIETTIAPRPM